MKKLIYLVVFLLTLSLALAITVKTDKTDYNGNELVTISTDCLGTSIVKIIDPFSNLVDIKSGENSWKAVYNTLSSSSDGKYKITASCQEGIIEAYFCVDEPGCTVPPVIQQQPPAQQPADGGGGGGGGGWGCTPKWSCSDWSYCAANLQQTRTCFDQKNCQANKEETQDCLQCDESWICSLWSECSGGQNYRTCSDEHFCGTTISMPKEYKSCSVSTPPGPAPVQVSSQIPPPKLQLPAPSEESFLSKYLFHLIAGVSGLVVLVLIILLTVHFLKPKKASNIDELKEWIQKEKAMGASESSIRQSLAEKTDWKENEINEAFKGL